MCALVGERRGRKREGRKNERDDMNMNDLENDIEHICDFSSKRFCYCCEK